MTAIATDVRRPTEDRAIGVAPRQLPSWDYLEIGFCYARAVNDQYGLRLFANALIRKSQERQT
ncbi:hypothetical protein [Streptomyces tendae]|uniref:hypothetical protein n=1 Tax=Streptomyces tendae TaxID=1932 RepID=UPI0036FB73C9